MTHWRAVHGGLLIALMPLPLFFKQLERWPLYLLAPLTAYTLTVCAVRPLRRSAIWVRAGRFDACSIGATVAIIALSTTSLLGYHWLFQPPLQELADKLPRWLPVPLLFQGAFFACVNAVLEEAIYRGILLDALDSQLGPLWAVFIQGAAFGLVHARGYPAGMVGILMAAVYGVLLGLLQKRVRGLALPTLAHVSADAVIFGIIIAGTR